MNVKAVIAGIVIIVLVLFAFWGTNTSEPIDAGQINDEIDMINNSNRVLTEMEKKEVVKKTLNMYDYGVVNIILDSNSVLGNYVIVGMFSEGETEEDVNTQIMIGFGVLYGVWDDKDYYIVSLKEYNMDDSDNNVVCSYGIDAETITDYMSEKITATEMILVIEKECVEL